MPQPGRRRHQQLPVHHLVAVGVVGERADHVRRVINRRSHSHMIASSAQQMQAQTTYDDERYGVTPGNHFKTSRNKKTRGMGLPAGPHSCALWIARRTRAKSHNGVQESRSQRRGVKRGVERVPTVARALHTRPCRQMPIWEPSPNARRCFGRSRTWESAFDTFYVDLCEYVLRLVGSADAAEDLVQDLDR